MSAKWQRSKAWDDQHFPSWAAPAKILLRALSSITLAVILLSLVLLYGVLASIPIGLLALIPTWLVIAASLLGVVSFLVLPGVSFLRKKMSGATPSARFAATFFASLALGALGVTFWFAALWPVLRYDPVAHTGLRLFPAFVESYYSTTLRRLPALEMTEGQFYGFWPLRLILFLFVVNLITATVRRIEFRFVNLGVLTVHTGIIVLALGAMHYQSLKVEGDVLLLAGADSDQPGPMATSFMERATPALWFSLDQGAWTAIPIPKIPRYNNYGEGLSDRTLNIELPAIEPSTPNASPVSMSLVGFGSYVDMRDDWAPADAADVTSPDPANAGGPLIDLDFLSSLTQTGDPGPKHIVAQLRLPAGSPKDRVANVSGALYIEHVPDHDSSRWRTLSLPMPQGASYALTTIDSTGADRVVPIQPGAEFDTQGFHIKVKSIHATPPFPIITPGYEDADSSVAIVRVTAPTGETFDRWIFHRFPQLDQDLHTVASSPKPDRRPADPALKLTLLDASAVQVYIRNSDAIVRTPDGAVRTQSNLAPGADLELAPMISLRLTHVWPNSQRIQRPVAVPDKDQRKDFIGSYDRAAIALQLTSGDWRRTVWLSFARFMNVALGVDKTFTLPDGRSLRVAFSRAPHSLPGLTLRLADFEMIPYAHSDIPKDYLSQLVVSDSVRQRSYTKTTRLNHPLIFRAPFQWSHDRPWIANMIGSVVSLIAPNQYKFSQAGWDAEGWRQSLAQVEAGKLDRPRAAFTILGVGNNPGIYVIATGAVMVCLGIPWAFYIKPLIVRHKRDKLKRELAKAAPPPVPKPSHAEPKSSVTDESVVTAGANS